MTSINLLSFHESAVDIYANAVVSPEDSGFDLYCVKDEIIKPNALCHKIQLGVGAAMVGPLGNRLGYMLVPRSSTCKKGLRQSNSVGIIDSGYNNEICVIVDNAKNNECRIKKGDRLFQLVQYSGLPFVEHKFVDSLPESVRGLGGFGSTGQSDVISDESIVEHYERQQDEAIIAHHRVEAVIAHHQVQDDDDEMPELI